MPPSGAFVSIHCGGSTIIAMITEVSREDLPEIDRDEYIASASVDLLGEINTRVNPPKFQRGVTVYPAIGDTTNLITNQELRTVYAPEFDRCHQHRPAAAGPDGDRLCQRRRNAEQAFRRGRNHRRRQVDRRRRC